VGKLFDNDLLQRHRNILRFLAVVILSSMASMGGQTFWILIWLAPLPLCLYALEETMSSTICAVFATFFLITAALLLGAFYFPLEVIKTILYTILYSAITSAIVLCVFRYLTIQFHHWSASLIFASGITAFEFIASRFSSGGTISSIAYTQVTNLPVIQIASITGIWGITFLLSVIPAGMATMWYCRRNHRQYRAAIWVPVSLLVLVLLFGACRLYSPSQGPSLTIGVVAEPMTLEQYIAVEKNSDLGLVSATMKRYTRDIEILSQAGAQAVLLPEKTFTISSRHDILQPLGTSARQNNIYLIAGVNSQDSERFYNSAFVFAPTGEVLLRYDKQHLLPPYEDRFTPGNSLKIVQTAAIGNWGIAICKDMDFTYPALDYSRQGVNILFVPALDFHDDGWTHGRVAVMRGVEGNYAVARAGQWGLLTLSDGNGRITAMRSTDASPNEALLIGEVRLGAGKSVYSRLGNWFAWSCLIVFALSLIILFSRKGSIAKTSLKNR
jgi:apolipoprotein N-acyltransferase